MFYKIDPKREQMVFDLAAEGFLTGDRVWVDLRGDFRPTFSGSTATDTFSNTSFELGGVAFAATLPTVVRARGTTLLALNHDEPLGDNSDPDNDYGVLVRLAAFTAGDDVFRFGARTELPQVQGSIYQAGAGDDFVTMPNAPVAGFNHRRVFQAGPGDDAVRAGTLDVRVNFGAGEDSFLERGARVAWATPENRDNDSTLVVTTVNGERHEVSNAEVLVDGKLENPLVKWYFDIDPTEDGRFAIGFYENGRLVREGSGFYDEALPVLEGAYQASFRIGAAQGELIRLDGTGGRPDVFLHRGVEGGAEADLVTSRAFLKAVFRHIDAAYDDLGRELPWRKGFAPLVPVTVAVVDTDQPFLRMRDLAVEDRRASVVAPRLRLENDGDAPGLEAQSVQVFFKVEGTADPGRRLGLRRRDAALQRPQRLRRRRAPPRPRRRRRHGLLGDDRGRRARRGRADPDPPRPGRGGPGDDRDRDRRPRPLGAAGLGRRALPPVRGPGRRPGERPRRPGRPRGRPAPRPRARRRHP